MVDMHRHGSKLESCGKHSLESVILMVRWSLGNVSRCRCMCNEGYALTVTIVWYHTIPCIVGAQAIGYRARWTGWWHDSHFLWAAGLSAVSVFWICRLKWLRLNGQHDDEMDGLARRWLFFLIVQLLLLTFSDAQNPKTHIISIHLDARSKIFSLPWKQR